MKKGRKTAKNKDIELFAELMADVLLKQILNNKKYADRERLHYMGPKNN